MKKNIFLFFIFISLIFISTPKQSFSELNMGNWLIEASSGLSYESKNTKNADNNDNETKEKIIDFSLDCSKLITDNIAIGGKIDYEKTDNDGIDSDETTLIFSFSGAYFFNLADKNAHPNVKLAIGSADRDEKNTNMKGVAFEISGGLLYFITPSVGLNISIGYRTADYDCDKESSSSSDEKYDTTENTTGIDVGVSFRI